MQHDAMTYVLDFLQSALGMGVCCSMSTHPMPGLGPIRAVK